MYSNNEINAAEAAAAAQKKALFQSKLAASLAKAKVASGKHVAPSSSNSNSELNQNIHELAAASSTGTAPVAPLFSLATGQPTQPASNAAASSTATATAASQPASMSQPAHTSAALPLSANLSGTVASMTNGISHTIANPGAAGANGSGAAGEEAVPARGKITSQDNFNSAEKAAMAAKAEKNKATVEIDVPTRGSLPFKTYQISHEPLKNLQLKTLDPQDKKLILGDINQIYEKYMIDKMKNPKDGKQYVRITYLGRDYLVRMQPMDSISDIKKAIEKTGPGVILNKLSAAATGKPTTPYPDIKGMSLVQLALEGQKAKNEINEAVESAEANYQNRSGSGKSYNKSVIQKDRLNMIESQMRSSLELLTTPEFTQFYQQAEKAHASGKMQKDQFEPYKKEKLLRDEEQRTFAITNINDLKPKDIPIELGRIERQYIRDGKSLDQLHTDDDRDAKRYRDIRVVFASKLADNSKRWGWWQDWKGPEYNRYRTTEPILRKKGVSMAEIYANGASTKGGYTAKKSKKNNKTKKSTRRSS